MKNDLLAKFRDQSDILSIYLLFFKLIYFCVLGCHPRGGLLVGVAHSLHLYGYFVYLSYFLFCRYNCPALFFSLNSCSTCHLGQGHATMHVRPTFASQALASLASWGV